MPAVTGLLLLCGFFRCFFLFLGRLLFGLEPGVLLLASLRDGGRGRRGRVELVDQRLPVDTGLCAVVIALQYYGRGHATAIE